jgi:hypothetical protein
MNAARGAQPVSRATIALAGSPSASITSKW